MTQVMFRLVFCTALMMVMVACTPSRTEFGVGDLPMGDAQRGAELFTQTVNGAPACSECHTTDNSPKVGPTLAGFAERAAERVSNQGAEEYTFNSMVRPASYLVRGFSNLMYNDYADKLSRQNIADLIAYLLSL